MSEPPLDCFFKKLAALFLAPFAESMAINFLANPDDDVFGISEETMRQLELETDQYGAIIVAQRTERKQLFDERLAYVCDRMKVQTLHQGQIDVLRLLEKKKDVCLLARTGFGKSLVFQSLYWMDIARLRQEARHRVDAQTRPRRRVTIVFIPLSGLGEEQVVKLNIDEGGEVAFFYDQRRSEPYHLNDIANGKYRMVYMSPEKAMHPNTFTKLWAESSFRAKVNLIAIDEVHLVHDWGANFRKCYSQLGEIRAYFNTTVPWLLCSATLPMQVKDEVLDTLRIKNAETIITDLNRANCYYNIILGGGSSYSSGPSAIDFLFDECIGPTSSPESIPKTLIYFEDIPTLQAFQAHLRELLPSHLEAQSRRIVEAYFANRTTDIKSQVRAEFLSGKFCRVVCTTEAFGMGMDIPDITRVFQWSLPKSVSSLIQRFGRAARDKNLQACCSLVISQDYYRITCEDDFVPTNDTQRNLAKNRPDLYHILRSKCIRQGFMKYLGVENRFEPPMPGTGKCCSRCSQSDKVPGAIIGIDGLCNPEKEEGRKATVKIKRPPKSPARAIPILLKHLKT